MPQLIRNADVPCVPGNDPSSSWWSCRKLSKNVPLAKTRSAVNLSRPPAGFPPAAACVAIAKSSCAADYSTLISIGRGNKQALRIAESVGVPTGSGDAIQ